MAESVPPSSHTPLEPGLVLDRYELLCTIARGGMAHVWLGRFKGKHGFEKLVAIKTILPEHALDARFQHMFLDEARIASGIEHPNVAKILDLGEWRDTLYLVMEYVDGDPLSRLRRSLERRAIAMPVPVQLRILADACAGLHAAHELRGEDNALLGVVHRDVSPQNILVPNSGLVKLIDFGVAKARDRLGEETGAGYAKGKSRYMAPEQAIGGPIDRRADVFAMGALAYEMFVGFAPYDGPNDMARLHSLITGEEIRSVKNAPHPSVEKLVLKALARDPNARFGTAAEMRTALEDAMVQMKIHPSTDDVGAFVTEHMGERAAERKRVVKLALQAATDRQRIKDMLEQGTVSGKRGSRPDDDSSPNLAEEIPPAAEIPAEPLLSTSTSPPAYSSSLHETEPSPTPKRRRWGIVGLAAAGALIFLIGVGAMLNHRAPRPIASTSASTSLAATSTPPSSIPEPASIAEPPLPTTTPTASAKPIPSAKFHPIVRATGTGSRGKLPRDVVIQ